MMKRLLFTLLVVLALTPSVQAQTWTATLVSATKANTGESMDVVIDFSDGKQTNHLTFRISEPASLAQIARNQIAQYEKIAAFVTAPPLGPIDTSVPPPPEPPVPDPTTVKVQAFQTAYQTFKQQMTAIKIGLLDAADPVVVQAQEDMKANFVPEAVKVLDPTPVDVLPVVKGLGAATVDVLPAVK